MSSSSNSINSDVTDATDPVAMQESECQVRHPTSTAKECGSQRAKEIYLEDLREYIAWMNGSLGDGWHVEFKFCDQRFKTYAVYEGPNGIVFESRDDVARHLGLHRSCSYRLHKRRANPSSPGISFFHNGGSSTYLTDDFPVQFEDFVLISAGKVDHRPSYHSKSEIWPVGYLSTWHDRITGSVFLFEVADGGDPGPVFKVRRYPCGLQPLPIGSTILARSDSHIGDNSAENGTSATFEVIDEEIISIEALLADCSPPDLSYDTLTPDNHDKFPVLEKVNCPGVIAQEDSIGEFRVQGRSVSSVWDLVSQTIQLACTDAYKQKGVIEFCCTHNAHNIKMGEKRPCKAGSLARFSYLGGPFNFPRIVHSSSKFKAACKMLDKWLKQDRFGFGLDFVQEIIEQLPEVSTCSSYKLITKRKRKRTQQTVGSRFLLAKRKIEKEAVYSFGISGTSRKHPVHSDIIGSRSSGKPFSTEMPMLLIRDAIRLSGTDGMNRTCEG